jgi:hypothetical protein
VRVDPGCDPEGGGVLRCAAGLPAGPLARWRYWVWSRDAAAERGTRGVSRWHDVDLLDRPATKVSDTVVEPYNCKLSVRQVGESRDQIFRILNQALDDICLRTLNCRTRTYGDPKHVVSMVTSGAACSLRLRAPARLATPG